MASMPQSLTGLARRLVADGIVSEHDALEASKTASQEQTSLVTVLVRSKKASPLNIALAASSEFGDPYFDLASLNTEMIPKNLVEDRLIRRHNILPIFKRGNKLFVATSDPNKQDALRDIGFASKMTTESIIVEEDKLTSMLEVYFHSKNTSINVADTDLNDLEFEEDNTQVSEEISAESAEDEAPVVRFIAKMLKDAIASGASDLHFEPYEKMYRVRYRVDGVLREVFRPPVAMATRIASRLKVMSTMDIAEKRVPQDGRIKLRVSQSRAIDFRVNSLPTLFGEKIVLRILDPSSAKLGIDALGYELEQKTLFLEALERAQGMLLITGPTGSGKTVSLYTGLNILNQPDINISTAEDPVEINLEGINQVNVNVKTGLTFAAALKSFLRQDPDVIMVGEIRDLETAEIAIKAAQTGHMVMSTLHTNSAPETLTRLRNMGVPSFNIATSVNLVIAQRLARRLCPVCKAKKDYPIDSLYPLGFLAEDFPPEDLAKGSTQFYDPIGCDACKDGYKGRVGIYEVMKVTPTIQRIIMEEGNSILIAEQARREGFPDLRRSGIKKALAGMTSLQEIMRVTTD